MTSELVGYERQGLVQLVLLWNGQRGSCAPSLETQPS